MLYSAIDAGQAVGRGDVTSRAIRTNVLHVRLLRSEKRASGVTIGNASCEWGTVIYNPVPPVTKRMAGAKGVSRAAAGAVAPGTRLVLSSRSVSVPSPTTNSRPRKAGTIVTNEVVPSGSA